MIVHLSFPNAFIGLPTEARRQGIYKPSKVDSRFHKVVPVAKDCGNDKLLSFEMPGQMHNHCLKLV